MEPVESLLFGTAGVEAAVPNHRFFELKQGSIQAPGIDPAHFRAFEKKIFLRERFFVALNG